MVLCEAEFQCLLESSVICHKNNTIIEPGCNQSDIWHLH